MSPRGRLSRKQRERALLDAALPAAAPLPDKPAPEIAETRALHIEAAQAGERLDRTIATLLPELSRARVQQLIEQGLVLLEGKPVRSSVRLEAGASIEVQLPRATPSELTAVQLDLPVLYDDAALAVIDKPAGIAVHPGAGAQHATIVHGLLFQLPGLAGIGGELRPGIVHRLDKDTSGCLVVAKSEPVLRGLQAAFKARTVEKTYLALVHGAPADSGEFDTLYGRHPTDRKRFSSKVHEGKRAITRFRVLARSASTSTAKKGSAADAADQGAALLEIELFTGRTHQIRAHFADAGFPLLHDALYGGVKRESKLPEGAPALLAARALGRQGLHAFHLAFAHPLTGVRVSCTAPLPSDFRAALQSLGIHFDSLAPRAGDAAAKVKR